jgi:23S rRNA (pseudouridine1915-N3)-methyltransferase
VKALILAVSDRSPGWIEDGYADYISRLRGRLTLEYRSLRLAARGKGRSDQEARRDESQRLLAAVPAGGWRIALDSTGKAWSSEQLAEQLTRWQVESRLPCFLIGGPDGLLEADRDRCEQCWSLGAITLPHALVRVIVAEQLYRAHCILDGHPYHR